ncbi:MAG: M20/M25/M40 family metallo-hydrolase [Planctomycetota bacterium]|nr:MAG: M20/M25/M40 family metallo-hydrolase [Planctomycetota bacterium]
MKKIHLLTLAAIGLVSFIIVSQCSSGPPEPLTAKSFLEHVKFLADPKLEGRLPGTEGCRKAGDYIAGKLKSWSVEPLGDNGSFFQKADWKSRRGEKIESRNVIGIIRGSDEKMKKEAILIVAHYDHVGKASDPGGKKKAKIYTGANDNASGVAALLEAARMIKERKLKPKRSIVFLASTGEETGMHGSGYYTEHPTFPLEKTQAVINADQVGGYERGVAVMGVHMSPQFDNALDAALKGADIKVSRQKIAGRGDNASFNNRFIPSLFFWTGYGNHYHKTSDTVKNINSKKGAEITEVIIKLAAHLADVEKIETIFSRPRGSYRPFVGIGYDTPGDGLRLTSVVKGSPADKAGLKKGDLITAMDKHKLGGSRRLSEILSEYKPGDAVEVTVKRGKKTMKLKITLGKR